MLRRCIASQEQGDEHAPFFSFDMLCQPGLSFHRCLGCTGSKGAALACRARVESADYCRSTHVADRADAADGRWDFCGCLGRAAGASALDQARGGTETVSNEARLSGFVTGNSASYVSTGANTIDGAAFANASGIPIVIQNSGANVLIQNATIINLQLR